MTRRIVRLLDPPELTPRQLAQRKYQQSHKGKAAQRRAYRKRAKSAAYRAEATRRATAWAKANPMQRRVYKRIWQRTQKLLKAQRSAQL